MSWPTEKFFGFFSQMGAVGVLASFFGASYGAGAGVAFLPLVACAESSRGGREQRRRQAAMWLV